MFRTARCVLLLLSVNASNSNAQSEGRSAVGGQFSRRQAVDSSAHGNASVGLRHQPQDRRQRERDLPVARPKVTLSSMLDDNVRRIRAATFMVMIGTVHSVF